ncbi:hypothetical protein ACFQU7_13170 [Pseudoroseomonas wenyumeiae]
MARNIYGQPDFFAGYSQFSRLVRGLDGAPEWPALRAMLPPMPTQPAGRCRGPQGVAVEPLFGGRPRSTDWLAGGVVKHHRTTGATLNALIAAGFGIRHVEEFCPTPAQIAAWPELAKERARPMFLLVAARRNGAPPEL